MAQNGWYPDPGGAPNRFRYWNGSGWSAETTDDPRTPPPGATPGPTPGPTPGQGPARRSTRWAWLAGALALVLIIVVIAVLVVRAGSPSALTDPNPRAPTISGWNDSSPLPTASPTPTPSPPPTSASQAPQGQVACATGRPYETQPHPADGRIHGGSLSIAQPGGDWQRADAYARQMTWAYDVSGADEWVEPEWLAMVAVGDVHTADGFHNPKQAADGIMQCVASSAYYQYFTGETTIFSRSFSLDGRSGWAIRAQVRVDDPDVQASGDVVEIIVLDTGVAGKLSYFAGFVPIGDQARLKILDTTIAGLRVG